MSNLHPMPYKLFYIAHVYAIVPGESPKPNHMFCMTFWQCIRPKSQFPKILSYSSHGMTNKATVELFLSSKARCAPDIDSRMATQGQILQIGQPSGSVIISNQ